jgi:hypothetical protein
MTPTGFDPGCLALAATGLTLRRHGNRLAVRPPCDDPDLRAWLREFKPVLLALLPDEGPAPDRTAAPTDPPPDVWVRRPEDLPAALSALDAATIAALAAFMAPRPTHGAPATPPTAWLAPDEAPWLPVAEAVLRGEYAAALRSEVQSALIGVRSVRHPTCQQARAELLRLLPEDDSLRLLPKARREPPRKRTV